jgi:HK97 family phage major capsid protein
MMMAFGDLSQSSTLAERRQLVVASSTHRAFDQDQILIHGTQRVHALTHTVGDAATKAPIAMLIGTA